jgi:hypothetical protein
MVPKKGTGKRIIKEQILVEQKPNLKWRGSAKIVYLKRFYKLLVRLIKNKRENANNQYHK